MAIRRNDGADVKGPTRRYSSTLSGKKFVEIRSPSCTPPDKSSLFELSFLDKPNHNLAVIAYVQSSEVPLVMAMCADRDRSDPLTFPPHPGWSVVAGIPVVATDDNGSCSVNRLCLAVEAAVTVRDKLF